MAQCKLCTATAQCTRRVKVTIGLSNQLQHGFSVLENLIAEGTLSIVGAEYSLETGAVEFFDAPAST